MIELSKFYVSVANKKYSQLSSDYDIVVQNYTELIILGNFAPITIQPTFQFHSLHQMEQLKIDSLYGWQINCFVFVCGLESFNFLLRCHWHYQKCWSIEHRS
jgi:hypothetical protein